MRRMSFPRMKDREARAPERRQQRNEAGDEGLEARRRVALGVEVSACAEEVALHVDDEERGGARGQRCVVRPGVRIRGAELFGHGGGAGARWGR